ncbi:CHAT domain-containing protein [Actinoplanes sp. NBC_00393]|uniref:CHAT domain-containing protein n=1 Tax=Actinoplanes sp. NBC_00393 TaxID=2975953 RepID=UPI002E1FA215
MSYGELNALTRDLAALHTRNLQRSQGRRDDLLTDAALLEARARRLGVPALVAVAMLRRAAILTAAERWREALAVAGDARPIVPADRPDLMIRALSLTAEASAGLRDWPALESVCARGIALVEDRRYKVSAPYMQSSYLRFSEPLYRLGVRAALERGDVEAVLQRAELVKARGVLRGRATDALSDEDAQQRFQALGRRLAQTADSDEVAQLRTERRWLWDLIAIGRLRNAAGDLPDFSVDAVQRRLSADETVLYYFWLDQRQLLVVTLDRRDVAVQRLTLSGDEADALSLDAHRITTMSSDRSVIGGVVATWPKLLPELSGGTRRLLVSPHQHLHAIPFHALRCDGGHLIDRLAVMFIPNLTSLLLTYRQRPVRRVLTIGIGHYDQPGQSAQPPSLANAEAEARATAQIYSEQGAHSIGLYSTAATGDRLRRWAATGYLSRFDCIHIASHAENVLGDTPMESRLHLYDEVLDGLEISTWRLQPETVVLSACSAGQRSIGGRGLDGVPGDEVFGLQAALFTAGAHRIISPLWPVHDAVGPALTGILHRHLVTGCPPEVAHQRAVAEFRAAARPVHKSPQFWAPFCVTALGRVATQGEQQWTSRQLC